MQTGGCSFAIGLFIKTVAAQVTNSIGFCAIEHLESCFVAGGSLIVGVSKNNGAGSFLDNTPAAECCRFEDGLADRFLGDIGGDQLFARHFERLRKAAADQ